MGPAATVFAAMLVMVRECGTKRAMAERRHKAPPRPLDARRLGELALRYVSRYATTRAKLRHYLVRKLRERGWAGEGEAKLDDLVTRLTDLGYIDDRAVAMSKASAHQARGLGKRRLAQSLRAAGISDEDSADAFDQAEAAAIEAVVRFAKRRRLGPFAMAKAQLPRDREKAIGALIRGGHSIDLARLIIGLDPEREPDVESLCERLSHTRR